MLVLTTCRAELCILSFLNCLFLNEFLELEAGKYSEETIKGNALVIQWLGLHAFPAEGKGSSPGLGLKSGKLRGAANHKKKKEDHEEERIKNVHLIMLICCH